VSLLITEPEDLRISEADGLALRDRLHYVRGEIAAAARLAGRQPEEITLIGVSKFQPAALALAAVDLGLQDLGENRVQEMTAKIDVLAAAGRRPRWHMIGTLQRNKVKMVVGRADLIHSVDSLELLLDIGRISQNLGLASNILLEVNAGGEITKHGFEPDTVARAAEQAAGLAGVRLCGLMAMAPLFPDPDQTLPVFSMMQTIFDTVARQVDVSSFRVLSMGMSHDFRQAISCGATHVRIGTAIFGPRL
jgi:PLP dependent protein